MWNHLDWVHIMKQEQQLGFVCHPTTSGRSVHVNNVRLLMTGVLLFYWSTRKIPSVTRTWSHSREEPASLIDSQQKTQQAAGALSALRHKDSGSEGSGVRGRDTITPIKQYWVKPHRNRHSTLLRDQDNESLIRGTARQRQDRKHVNVLVGQDEGQKSWVLMSDGCFCCFFRKSDYKAKLERWETKLKAAMVLTVIAALAAVRVQRKILKRKKHLSVWSEEKDAHRQQ